ncbi:MAG: site-specific recombinase [Calothrix sp. SM1_5_4]|nr:site-specific recombinase [Calothrix sp. SM1_5_4]
MAEIRRFKLMRFLTSNVELLAYQITEHTGKAGEHYITRTRKEWAWMFKSAVLGGVLVAVIATIKMVAAKLHLPPGPEALTYGLIYGVGFVVLHTMGATLATKQPAMTASKLAASLDEAKTSHSAMDNLAEMIVRTVRSQMAALLGNFIFAFPAAILLSLPFFYFGIPIMGPEKAKLALDSLHGLRSLSFFYAALAGVCLFISGLLAGFADNWFVFNHVGSRLGQSNVLRRFVGSQNLERAVQTIDHNLGFWVGNMSLGLMLGSMAALGTITGLPLDVRHITFSSAQFGAALMDLKFQVPLSLAIGVGVSVFMMGLINLTVSFSLTLFVVVKSRRIRFSQTPLLLKLLLLRLRSRPLEFVFPAKDPAQ